MAGAYSQANAAGEELEFIRAAAEKTELANGTLHFFRQSDGAAASGGFRRYDDEVVSSGLSFANRVTWYGRFKRRITMIDARKLGKQLFAGFRSRHVEVVR